MLSMDKKKPGGEVPGFALCRAALGSGGALFEDGAAVPPFNVPCKGAVPSTMAQPK